ncbi:MAG: hypothetical protein WC758_04630 [Candidatus Woesearchaeota archaeon]|jgi:hypothetical protein
MGLFSKKKEQVDGKGENKFPPKTLPDTLMQRISTSQNNSQEVRPQKIYVDDVKAVLQAKDEHKRIPQEFISKQTNDRGPERHEMEKVLMIKQDQPQTFESLNSQQVKVHKYNLPSFFIELERRMLGHTHLIKQVSAQDLLSKMKDYHIAINNGDSFFMHELEIEEQIAKSISLLKDVESDWLLTKRQVATAEKILLEKENELERRLVEFKGLLLAAEKFKAYSLRVNEDQAFILSDGTKLYSLQNLMNELPRMNDEIFSFHVNLEKNDFASWIRNVFKLEELATKLILVKTKEELLLLLKNN